MSTVQGTVSAHAVCICVFEAESESERERVWRGLVVRGTERAEKKKRKRKIEGRSEI